MLFICDHEIFILQQENRIFKVFHRQLFCWTDRWYGLTMADIRALEDQTQAQLKEVSH